MFAADAQHWLDTFLFWLARQAPPQTFFAYSYNLRALLALVLVGLACGTVGSLVVGGRMAFFSDALAHCSFAGVSIGFVVFTYVVATYFHRPADEFWDWVTPVMLAFAMLVGYGIAAVRERTALASDTVIGIFFAFCLGLASTLRKVFQSRRLFNLEEVMFGEPLSVRAEDVLYLAVQLAAVVVVLAFIYNSLLLTGFNSSLALSRQVRARLSSYLFIMLLAVVVTLSVRTVGVLLINALLVVPAATACNLANNLRQLFWLTVVLCLAACVLGMGISWEVYTRTRTDLGIAGTVILVSVALFVLSALLGPWVRRLTGRPSAQNARA